MSNSECDNSLPKTFFKGTYRWMFGILKISVLIEDRRPDLEVGKYDGKYKTQIGVFLFGKRIFSTLARGTHAPSVYIDPDSPMTRCETFKTYPGQ